MNVKHKKVTLTSQIIACNNEMKNELNTLKQDISFREYIGFEIALKQFQERFSRILTNI